MISLRRLATGSFLRGVDVVVQVFATLWITPLLIHALGTDRYGLWVTVITLVTYLDIFDLGLTSAVTRYVSRALGRGDENAACEVVRSAFSILLSIGVACLPVVALLAFGARWFSDDHQIQTLILILGATIALSFPMRVFAGVLEAHVRYEFTTAASITRTIVATVAMWWVVQNGANLTTVVIVIAAAGLFQRALNYLFARSVFPAMRLFPLGWGPAAKAELLEYGWKNFMMKILDIVRFRIDNVVIAIGASYASVSVYSVGMALIRYFRELVECFGAVFMPVFSRAEGAGDRTHLRERFVIAMRLCGVVSTFFAGCIILYGGLFIERWLGRGFADSHRVAMLLAVPFLLAMAQNPGIHLLYGLSKQERLLRLNIIEAIANFTLSVALVFRYGIFGVAAGTAISLLCSKLLLQPILLCEEIGLSRRQFYFELLLFPIGMTAIAMFACHWLITPWVRPTYPHLIAAGALQTVVVALVCWRFFAARLRSGVLPVVDGRTA